MDKNKKTTNVMNVLKHFSRIFLGLIFVFSGFVKAVDPYGSLYKMQDYFVALNMDFLYPMALFFGCLLFLAEFLIGAALLFNIKTELASWGALIFMVIFTPLTLWLAIDSPVHDCGCFGDAIILSNWGTFLKNIFLDIFLAILFIKRKTFKSALQPLYDWIVVGLIITFVVLIASYSYRNLPVVDFRAWSEGEELLPEPPPTPQVYLVYSNIDNENLDTLKSVDLPYDDTLWMDSHEFVESFTDAIVLPENMLSVFDYDNNEVTQNLKIDNAYQFVVVSYNLGTANKKALEELNVIYEKAMASDENYDMMAFSGSLWDEIDSLSQEYDMQYPIYNGDDISLKTVVRSNPGLVLLYDGKIIRKWHYRNIPDFEEINEKKGSYADKHKIRKASKRIVQVIGKSFGVFDKIGSKFGKEE